MDKTRDLLVSGIVPVVVIDDPALSQELAGALLAGGISVAEVTFRTAAAADSIASMSQVDGMFVGAGTITTPEQVDTAAAAGARFIVSPGLLPSVVSRAQELGLPVIPGCATPSEIMLALSLGLDLLKFFPANVYGGTAALRALHAPFQNVRFIPTGGVNAANLGEYISLPNVAAVGGTWMVKPELLQQRDFSRITELSRTAVETVSSFRKDNL